jgi:hypothetical protein
MCFARLARIMSGWPGLLLVALLAGCSSSTGSGLVTIDAGAAADAPGVSPTVGAALWLAPSPLTTTNATTDLADLLASESAWPQAAAHVQVLALPVDWVEHHASADDLIAVGHSLARRRSALALEGGALPGAACTDYPASSGSDLSLSALRRLRELAVPVSLFVIDHPFDAGLYDSTCARPPAQVATDVQTFVSAARAVRPGLVVGMSEDYGSWIAPSALLDWVTLAGPAVTFLHVVPWTGWDDVARVAALARARGVTLGMRFEGDYNSADDTTWIAGAADGSERYELAAGPPDQVVFHSDWGRPAANLPESSPAALARLVVRYLRPRPTLTLSVGGQRVGGRLVDAAGTPAVNATVVVSEKALDGPGAYATTSVQGVVPASAKVATVILRVNTECGDGRAADLRLYGATFLEGGNTTNRVIDSDFSTGDWGGGGNGTAALAASDHGAGSMLHVQVGSGLYTWRNSPGFPVTAGATYNLTIAAAVAPAAEGAGCFGVIFLDKTEVSRVMFAFQAAVTSGLAQTTPTGGFQAMVAPLTGARLVTVRFPGNDALFPAQAEAKLP